MSDSNCCTRTHCAQGLVFPPHLHCSPGVCSQHQDATSPTRPDPVHPGQGEQARELGDTGQALGGQRSHAGVRGITATAPLEEEPPALLSFAPILSCLCMVLTELLHGSTSAELRTDVNNFHKARMLFLCILVAFISVCVSPIHSFALKVLWVYFFPKYCCVTE